MSFSLIRQLSRSSILLPRHVPPPQLNTFRHSRTYASKAKVKSTASFVPGSQQLFASEDSRAEYAKVESKMATAVDWFRKEVARFETRASGRVTPALLAPVRVTLVSRRGEAVKLDEVATVGVKDGSMLLVTVFDEHVRRAFLSLLWVVYWYVVERESGRARDLCCQATQHCPSTAGSPHVQNTHTQVGPFFRRSVHVLTHVRPTVEARNALVSTASRMAEDVRVQIRKHHQVSLKKGKYGKHSVELVEVSLLYTIISGDHIWCVSSINYQTSTLQRSTRF